MDSSFALHSIPLPLVICVQEPTQVNDLQGHTLKGDIHHLEDDPGLLIIFCKNNLSKEALIILIEAVCLDFSKGEMQWRK
jgi:hypothetical protein